MFQEETKHWRTYKDFGSNTWPPTSYMSLGDFYKHFGFLFSYFQIVNDSNSLSVYEDYNKSSAPK